MWVWRVFGSEEGRGGVWHGVFVPEVVSGGVLGLSTPPPPPCPIMTVGNTMFVATVMIPPFVQYRRGRLHPVIILIPDKPLCLAQLNITV